MMQDLCHKNKVYREDRLHFNSQFKGNVYEVSPLSLVYGDAEFTGTWGEDDIFVFSVTVDVVEFQVEFSGMQNQS